MAFLIPGNRTGLVGCLSLVLGLALSWVAGTAETGALPGPGLLRSGHSDPGPFHLPADKGAGVGNAGMVNHCEPDHCIDDGMDFPDLPVFLRGHAADRYCRLRTRVY